MCGCIQYTRRRQFEDLHLPKSIRLNTCEPDNVGTRRVHARAPSSLCLGERSFPRRHKRVCRGLSALDCACQDGGLIPRTLKLLENGVCTQVTRVSSVVRSGPYKPHKNQCESTLWEDVALCTNIEIIRRRWRSKDTCMQMAQAHTHYDYSWQSKEYSDIKGFLNERRRRTFDAVTIARVRRLRPRGALLETRGIGVLDHRKQSADKTSLVDIHGHISYEPCATRSITCGFIVPTIKSSYSD